MYLQEQYRYAERANRHAGYEVARVGNWMYCTGEHHERMRVTYTDERVVWIIGGVQFEIRNQ